MNRSLILICLISILLGACQTSQKTSLDSNGKFDLTGMYGKSLPLFSNGQSIGNGEIIGYHMSENGIIHWMVLHENGEKSKIYAIKNPEDSLEFKLD